MSEEARLFSAGAMAFTALFWRLRKAERVWTVERWLYILVSYGVAYWHAVALIRKLAG